MLYLPGGWDAYQYFKMIWAHSKAGRGYVQMKHRCTFTFWLTAKLDWISIPHCHMDGTELKFEPLEAKKWQSKCISTIFFFNCFLKEIWIQKSGYSRKVPPTLLGVWDLLVTAYKNFPPAIQNPCRTRRPAHTFTIFSYKLSTCFTVPHWFQTDWRCTLLPLAISKWSK